MSNAEKRVRCAFCNNEHLSSAIGEHLMLCGNKTDQCPKCEKYIRRAVFAYHYENNCDNLDETDGDSESKPDSTSTSFSNDPARSSTVSATRDHSKIAIRTINLGQFSTEQHTPISLHIDSGPSLVSVCPHCDQECELADSEKHRNSCLRRPKNMTNRSQVQVNPTLNQNEIQYNFVDQSNGTVDIPCEYCGKAINFDDYNNHTQNCSIQHHRTAEEYSPQIYRMDAPTGLCCRYCDHQYLTDYVKFHEVNCRHNPVNISFEEQRRRAYCLPPAARETRF